MMFPQLCVGIVVIVCVIFVTLLASAIMGNTLGSKESGLAFGILIDCIFLGICITYILFMRGMI